MRFAVTGATGLIGKSLVKDLASAGHRVLALYRSGLPEEFLNHQNIELAKGDLRDSDFLMRAIQNVDGVFHVAAFAKPWAKNPSLYYEVNEIATRHVCEACIKNGVRRLVYTASAGIHGPQQGPHPISEHTWPTMYHTDYEQSKYNGMRVALSYESQGLEVNVVSPARVYAAAPISESNVPARLMDMYLNKGYALVPTDGLGIGSYVYIDDIVHGHIIAMECKEHGEEFLLGGENVTYLQFFDTLRSLTNKSSMIVKVPYSLSLFIGKINHFLAEIFGIKPLITTPWVKRYLKHWGVSSKKMSALGYQPLSLKEGMKLVLESWNL